MQTIEEQVSAQQRRWLVTGSAGFIGSHLIEALLRLGQRVTSLDNFSTGHQRNLDEVALELTGDVAVFTARMTEHAESGGEHVSRVSQFWQRRNGRWFVTNVRIIGEARLNQIIR